MSNLPAWLQGAPPSRVSDTLGQNLGTSSPPYLSIQGNRLTLVDSAGDSEPVTTVDPKTGVVYLDCCIADVGDHASKIYYDKPFDPGAQSFSPPPCWSDNGIAPSVNATLPQATSCTPDPTGQHGCRWAVWGSKTSAISGKGVPACGKYQKLALLIPGDDVLFLLRVPPNSLENLRAYNAKFRGQPVGPEGVLTRISFEPQGLGTLTFTAINYVDEDTWRRRQAALVQKATDALVGRGDQPRPTGALPAPAPAPAPAQQTVAQQPLPNALPPPAQVPAIAPSPAPEAQPARRRRRTAAEMQAAQVPASPVPVSTTPAVAPFRPTDPPAAPAQNFGIAPGVAPNPEVQHAIDSFFGPR